MRAIEEKALATGITQEELMENAGKGIAEYITRFADESLIAKKVLLLAGKGNNAGDGYTAARLLLEKGFAVTSWQLLESEISSLCSKKKRAFKAKGGTVIELENGQLPELPKEGIILDGIFGIGFAGALPEDIAELIEKVNSLRLPIVAIDIPSGLNGETGIVESVSFHAHATCTMELPKQGFFLNQGWNHVGKVIIHPIGLHPFAEETRAHLQYLEETDIAELFPKIKRSRHKYEAGHVVALAGSHGMAGAAMMASWSALKSGAGIVHLLHPENLLPELTGAPWEVVRVPFQENDIATLKSWIQKAGACFIGPGLGSSQKTETLLATLWSDFKDKSVLDADCLNWLAKAKESFGPLPSCILTPHIGEMRRLLKEITPEPISLAFLNKCLDFTEKNTTHLLLKGGPSFLFSHGEPIIVMDRGDPGMATAGSGDVLTGILTSLLAQGLKPAQAMRLGSFLHGVAGEIAAEEETSYCMTATSIIEWLPSAFQQCTKLHMRHLAI